MDAAITRTITSLLWERAAQSTVCDVRIGLGYTAVLLTDGAAGLAYTFRNEAGCGCCAYPGPRPLAGRPATDLLPLLESDDRIEAAVGLACANALANRGGEDQRTGDILEYLPLRPEDDVAMVGYFRPLVDPIRRKVRSLVVFEQTDEPTSEVRPTREAPEALAQSQVALITATSLINHTLDPLLEAARTCRDIVLLGASTPLLPEAFSGRGVTLLSGVVVTDASATLRVVSEAGGMRQFGRHVQKVRLAVAAERTASV